MDGCLFAPVVSTGPGATCGNFKKLDVASVSCGGLRHADASSRLIPQGGPYDSLVAHVCTREGLVNQVAVRFLRMSCWQCRCRLLGISSPCGLPIFVLFPSGVPRQPVSGCLAAWPFLAASSRTCGACLKSEWIAPFAVVLQQVGCKVVWDFTTMCELLPSGLATSACQSFCLSGTCGACSSRQVGSLAAWLSHAVVGCTPPLGQTSPSFPGWQPGRQKHRVHATAGDQVKWAVASA